MVVSSIASVRVLPAALVRCPRPRFAFPRSRPSRTAAPTFVPRQISSRVSRPPFGLRASFATVAMSHSAAKPLPVADRLPAFRKLLAEGVDGSGPLDAFIVPSEDPHMSEHVPKMYERRAFLSGFTGSAGTLAVTQDAACLWTDGRYFLQASQQLGDAWTLQRAGVEGTPTVPGWLTSVLKKGSTVGVDARVHSITGADELRSELSRAGVSLVPLGSGPVANPVDAVWGDARPAAPSTPLRAHALEWAGKSASDKLAEVRASLAKEGARAILLSKLDEVAWALNVRGGDVPCVPVALAHLLVEPASATLFVDVAKAEPVAAELEAAGVAVRPYDDLLPAVERLGAELPAAARAGEPAKVWLDPSSVSEAVLQAALRGAAKGASEGSAEGKAAEANGDEGGDAEEVAAAAAAAGAPETAPAAKRARSEGSAPPPPSSSSSPDLASLRREHVVSAPSPVSMAKALKNDAELAGFKEAHLRDGAAFAIFASDLEASLEAGESVDEVEIDARLTGERAKQPGFVEPSFDTIAGVDANGAIIHYRAEKETCATLTKGHQLLLDSGGQYDCGTTDVTRTFFFGPDAPAHVKECYTRVLKGHIALDTLVYPSGTPGCAIDAFARSALWRVGLEYRHGTGHGVGAALDVHEGPQSVSARYYNHVGLRERMVISNEPGFYEDGGFGIRIENLVVVGKADTPHAFGGVTYLKHTPLTLIPISRALIDKQLLTADEVAWLDAYHARVREEIAPRLQGHERALAWLTKETEPL